jgi:transposase
MGAADRCTLERFTKKFSLAQHLLAPAPRMDEDRRLVPSLGTLAAKARPPRPTRLGRIDRRWHLRLGKKRGELVGKTKRGKGTKIMVHSEGGGLPVAVTIASASPHESTLIESLLDARVIARKPRRLLYDQAADSDPLRQRLAQREIELVCRHRRNRSKPATQDGRKLRRIKRRWKIERAIGWLQNFRRLVTRYEYQAQMFLGFVQAACMLIVIRQF